MIIKKILLSALIIVSLAHANVDATIAYPYTDKQMYKEFFGQNPDRQVVFVSSRGGYADGYGSIDISFTVRNASKFIHLTNATNLQLASPEGLADYIENDYDLTLNGPCKENLRLYTQQPDPENSWDYKAATFCPQNSLVRAHAFHLEQEM